MNTSLVQIKSLAVHQEKPLQGRIEAELENLGEEPFPDSVLMLTFFERDGKVRDRVSFKVKPIAPGETRDISCFYRLKSAGFFSYTARLEPESAR